jgi:hypothetical protein
MSVNMQRLLALAALFNIKDFVEAGTQNGDLFLAVEHHFNRAFTIDIDGPTPRLREKFANSNRVFLFTGSSGDQLGEILKDHQITRALFWLDAHGNQTFFVDDGKDQVPKELAAIQTYAPDSLVVIDDVTWEKGFHWVNSSYKLWIPAGWQVKYVGRAAILHRGAYSILEHI